MPIDEHWLALVQEEPLEPERPLLDPHHHLWEFETGIYLARDLAADIAGHNVRKTVFVECGAGYDASQPEALQPVGETRFIRAAAQEPLTQQHNALGVAAGISGFANLQLGADVAPVLRAHRDAAEGCLRGIRHSCTWHASEEIRNSHSNPPPQLFLRDDFRAGFEELERQGLLFEAWCYHTQLHELADLARSFPASSIVLNHVGGPLGIGPYAGKREEVFAEWCAGIDTLAACSNVVVKLGGLGMAINGFGWHKHSTPPTSTELMTAWRPYFEHCISRFGVERCMFESNFPVDKVSCSYTVLWNAFKQQARGFPQAAQDALLHDNAARIYRL